MTIRHGPFAKDLLPTLPFLSSATMFSQAGLLIALYFAYMKNTFSINSLFQTYVRHGQRNGCFAQWWGNHKIATLRSKTFRKFSMNYWLNLMKRFTRDLSRRIVLMGLLIYIDLATSLHCILPSSKVTELGISIIWPSVALMSSRLQISYGQYLTNISPIF